MESRYTVSKLLNLFLLASRLPTKTSHTAQLSARCTMAGRCRKQLEFRVRRQGDPFTRSVGKSSVLDYTTVDIIYTGDML